MTDQDASKTKFRSQLPHGQREVPCTSDLTGAGGEVAAGATTEGFFRILFEKAAEAIMIVDPTTRSVVQVNPSLSRMFGYDLDRIIGMPVVELHPEKARPTVVSWFESHMHDFDGATLEAECLAADGSVFVAALQVSLVETGGRPYVASFFTDITGRRGVENLARVQRDLAQTLNATSDLNSALRACLSTAIAVSNMDSGGIYLLDVGTGDLDLACSVGLAPEFVQHVSHIDAGSPRAHTITAGKPLFLAYAQLEESIGSQATPEGLRASAVVPVKHDGRVIACLNLASHVIDDIHELARNAIETIAASIGSAIARLRAEQAARESENRFRELTELLPQVVFELDGDGYITYANRYGFESLGFSQQSLDAGLHMLALIAPADRERAMDEFRSALSGAKGLGNEYMLVRKDGSMFPALVYECPIERDGRFVGTRGVVLDITERKGVETALRDSEERWHFALEGSGDGVWDWNALTNRVVFSRQWKAMLGYDEEDIGDSLDEWSSRVHPDDLEGVYAEIKKHFAGEIPTYSSEHRLRCKDGRYKWILDRGKVVSWTQAGKPERVIGTHTDITQRKRVEVALRDSQRRLADVIDFLPDATFAIDRQGKVIVWNRAMEEMTGVKAENILHKGNYEYALPFYGERRPILIDLALAPSNEVEKRYLYVEAQGDILLAEAELTMRGEPSTVLGKASPLYDDHGNIVGAIESIRDMTAHRRAEVALREREAKLGSIMAAAPIGIGIVSNRVLHHVNKTFCDMVGYAEDELINQSVAKLYLTGEEFDRVGREYGPMSSRGVSAIETVWRRKDGTTIEVILSVTPLDRSDWSKGITFTALDITERKRAESALRAAEEQYRVLFERAGEGIMVASGEYFALVNPAFCTLSGYSLEDLATLKIRDFIHPDHRDMVMDRYRRRQVGEQVPTGYDFKILTKSGETRWVRITSTIINWQGRRASLNFVEDITVNRLAQEEIRKFKTISDTATYGTVITDLDGTLLYVNEALARMHDYRPEDLLGHNLAVLHSDEQQRIMHRISEGLIHNGSFSSTEVWHRRRDGTIFPTLMNGVVIRDSGGQPQFLAATAADISELKRLQEFADRAKRLEAAGRIAGQVAHDFNNLLGPLVAYPEFIKEEIGATHSANAYLDTMEAAAQQMADINQQLLSLGRRGHYNLEPLNLNEVVRQVLQQLQIQTERLEVVTELSGDLMNIKAGAAQIVRVLSNLISNSVDAMQGAGTLTIATQNWYADNPHGAYGQIERGEYVKISVADTGCGIPEGIISQVFEPFFTTKKADKKRGSGLGLSVVHAIVEDHGGYVDIESSEQEGTSVYLYFPITREEPTTLHDNQIIGGKESILLVDDDHIQQEVTTRLLDRLGYRVVVVSNGEAAVQFLQRESADLVLLDMIMPGGMDGVETYRGILEFRPGQKAIIVSGFAEGGRVAEARLLGAGEFLKKPMTLKSLAQTVRRELDRVPDLQPV